MITNTRFINMRQMETLLCYGDCYTPYGHISMTGPVFKRAAVRARPDKSFY